MSDCCDCIRIGIVVGYSGNNILVDIDGNRDVYVVQRGNIVPQIGQEVAVDTNSKVAITAPKRPSRFPDVHNNLPSIVDMPYYPMSVAYVSKYGGQYFNAPEEGVVDFVAPAIDVANKAVDIAKVSFKFNSGTYLFDHTYDGIYVFRKKSDGKWLAIDNNIIDYNDGGYSFEYFIYEVDSPPFVGFDGYVDFVNYGHIGFTKPPPPGFIPCDPNWTFEYPEGDSIHLPLLGTGASVGVTGNNINGNLDGVVILDTYYHFEEIRFGTTGGTKSTIKSAAHYLYVDVENESVSMHKMYEETLQGIPYKSDSYCDFVCHSFDYLSLASYFQETPPAGSIVSSGKFSQLYTAPKTVTGQMLKHYSECTRTAVVEEITYYDYKIIPDDDEKMKYGISCCGINFIDNNSAHGYGDPSEAFKYIGTIGNRYDVWYKIISPAYVFAGNNKIIEVNIDSSILSKLGAHYWYHHISEINQYDMDVFWIYPGNNLLPVVFDIDYIDSLGDNGAVTIIEDDANIVYENRVVYENIVDTGMTMNWPYAYFYTVTPLISYTKYDEGSGSAASKTTFTKLPKGTDIHYPSSEPANMFVVYGDYGDVDGYVKHSYVLHGHLFSIYVSDSIVNGGTSNIADGAVGVGYKLYSSMFQ